MKTLKRWVMACAVMSLLATGLWLIYHKNGLVWHTNIATDSFGTVSVAYPLLGNRNQVLVFVDAKKYPPAALAERIARLGAHAAVVDAEGFIKTFSSANQQCLDTPWVAASISTLLQEIAMVDTKNLIVSGVGDGAVLPFLHAESPSVHNSTNLSIDFSVKLPDSLTLCPPFITSRHETTQNILTASPGLVGTWHAAWSDQPAKETAVFVKELSGAKTTIAAYDTASDALLVEELQKLINPFGTPSVPMAVVEVPATAASETVTIFYSGDGGWRDLDRIIAEDMAKQGYPVVGVDTLRSFWSRKTVEQATDDLVKTLDYYRKTWGAKSFVLAGYSFGADILPSIYNRLPPGDKESVRLLVFLAIGKQIDFEIQVSGWLGQSSGELPMAPELLRLPADKILCVYGRKEKDETACMDIAHTQADLLELPGGHHFDENYPKLTGLILARYAKAGIRGGAPATRRQ
jgi:type IV secretory pathway VirJ component